MADERRYDEREIFRPSENLERTVPTVIGGWAMVRAQVNFNGFTDAGPDAEWAGSDKLADTLREMAVALRIRHPHNDGLAWLPRSAPSATGSATCFTSATPRVSTRTARCASRGSAPRANSGEGEVTRWA